MVILSQPFSKPGPDFEAVTETDMVGPQPAPRYVPTLKQPQSARAASASHPLSSGVLLPP
jgi:hypothetical protein